MGKDNIKQLAEVIGSRGHIVAARHLRVAVKILDARKVFGRVELLVRPVAGSGTSWCYVGNVTLNRMR